MKEFACSSLVHGCKGVLKAQTEERLAELVALHLRDDHGMLSLPPEKIAQIKNLFTSPARSDSADIVDRIFEKYNCNGEPECTWRYIAAARDDPDRPRKGPRKGTQGRMTRARKGYDASLN